MSGRSPPDWANNEPERGGAGEIRAERNSENIGEELVDEEIPAPIPREPEKVDEASRDQSDGELRAPVEQHRPRQLLN